MSEQGSVFRRFKVELLDDFNNEIKFTVEITETEQAQREIKEMVECWRGWQGVLAKQRSDYTKAFVFYFAQAVESMKDDIISLETVKDNFTELEGFYSIFDNDWFKVLSFYNDFTPQSLDIYITEQL